jgi:hypothetical protein
MAQTSHHQPITTEAEASTVRGLLSDQRSLALRRLLAWGLELSLLVGSVAIPWGIGEAVRQRSEQPMVPLNPVTTAVQTAISPPLGLPKHRLVNAVPPITNMLWFTALVLPLTLAVSQLHGLARTGKTAPKAWLGLQVMALDHPVPGYWPALLREGSRWGLPWLGPMAFGLAVERSPNYPCWQAWRCWVYYWKA